MPLGACANSRPANQTIEALKEHVLAWTIIDLQARRRFPLGSEDVADGNNNHEANSR